MDKFKNLPQQKLSYKKKGVEWRKKHLDWADNKTFKTDSIIRKSIANKVINYNLVDGILDLKDVELIINPSDTQSNFIADEIQHYPIINSKLNLIRGEEYKRHFNPRVIVTNPEGINEIENSKKGAWMESIQELLLSNVSEEDEELFNSQLEKINDYMTYDWQDIREVRANFILNHYIKEYNLPLLFNSGMMDGMTVGEEIYQVDIEGGEPTIKKINPKKIQILKSGYSNKVEDADMILTWDYVNPGKIIDTYYDVLTKDDMNYISNIPYSNYVDNMDNLDHRRNMVWTTSRASEDGVLFSNELFGNDNYLSNNVIDVAGNIRVVKLYWKSLRKIKKVKSYNLETGEEEYNFYNEDHIINKHLGEEEETLWINEAWEGVKIGKDIYVNMRPRIVQYNRLNNPSICHFGIVGSFYNLNEGKPFSLVDMMKPYNYMYDVIHDRLNQAIAANWGKILKLDLAMIPSGWEIDKWLHFVKMNRIAVTDSFKEGTKGQAAGKLSGMMNNQSNGIIDGEIGNYIQEHINLLEFIKEEMSEVVGVTKQREGQISNRETVGGVERSTLQSSHITEWLFSIHDDVKKRTLECFLETAKIAMKGSVKKFQNILSTGAMNVMEIDGDEFAECDYGLVVDNSNETETLFQKLDGLAQSMIQNQMITASSLIKIYTDKSIANITRTIEKQEQEMKDSQAQAQQAEQEQFQMDLEYKQQLESEKLRILEEDNIRKAEVQILLKEMEKNTEGYSDLEIAKLDEQIRQFNETLNHQKNILKTTQDKNKTDKILKEKDLKIKNKSINTKINNGKER